MKINVARAINIERAISPRLQGVAHPQTFLLPVIQLERGEILLSADVGKGVHVRFEIERVAGRIVPLESSSKDVAANASLINQRRAQIAPENNRRGGRGPAPCHQHREYPDTWNFGHDWILRRILPETSRH